MTRHTPSSAGFALLTVLILLTVMLVAGTALFRNVDTASLIAGNSAARQAASQAGNLGLVAAQRWIESGLPGSATAGYAPKAFAVDAEGLPQAPDAAWSSETEAGNGYRYRHLVERLCNDEGICAESRSLGRVPGSSLGANAMLPTESATSIGLYRVTVKVSGPRSLQTHVQAVYGK